jgi:glycerate kinase
MTTTITRPAGVLVAMDKFRGTASARDLGSCVEAVVRRHGLAVDVQPMSDGGEGFSESFQGEDFVVVVPGPLDTEVPAKVKIVDTASGALGVIEVAHVVGRDLLVRPTSEEALAASSRGVGHLILAAVELGAEAVLVGCGGSSTSDGGLGCYEVLRDAGGLPVPVTAATDVTATFSGARRFARQKGVSPEDMALVDERLGHVRELYAREQGVDVELIERAGAAGGIAGAIAALGGELVGGLDAVAQAVGLEKRIGDSALVITGEGRFDQGSLEGKVTVGVAEMVVEPSRLLLVCGSIDEAAASLFRLRFPNAAMVSLEARFGLDRALHNVLECVAAVVNDELNRLFTPPGPSNGRRD